jgi:parallel beta-helix repeat protein
MLILSGKLSRLSFSLALVMVLVFFSLAFSPVKVVAAELISVTSINDDGEGSLRQAILAANAEEGLDTITFNLPGPGYTINLTSQLPDITDPVIIDGTSQPGIIVQGPLENPQASDLSCLVIKAGGTTIQGLTVQGFGKGIEVVNVPDNVIRDNIIADNYYNIVITGESASGSSLTGNRIGRYMGRNFYGVFIDGAPYNTIGGPGPNDYNIIGGNYWAGVTIKSGPGHNRVEGNYIGVTDELVPIYNPSTNQLLGYGHRDNGNACGIWLEASGGNAIKNNLVENNDEGGMNIAGCSEANYIQGNCIGSWNGDTADGISPQTSRFAISVGFYSHLGNSGKGICLEGSSNQVIGGSGAGEGNVIAYNAVGISLGSSGSSDARIHSDHNIIQGNDIYHNKFEGIQMFDGSDNLIGGNGAGEGNFFSLTLHTTGTNYLILLTCNSTGGSVVTGNSIIGNNFRDLDVYNQNVINLTGEVTSTNISENNIEVWGGMAIDLGGDGITANDPLDGDTGPNGLQNYPVLTSAYFSGDILTFSGNLNSTPSSNFHLEFFINGDYLQYSDVMTDTDGNAAFTVTTPSPLTNSTSTWNPVRCSATATDAANNTSEFSNTRSAENSRILSLSVSPSLVDITQSTVSANASYIDPLWHSPQIATWDWGDGTTSPGHISYIWDDNTHHDGERQYVTGTHTYISGGIYSVTLTLADDPLRDGAEAETMTFNYVVVYDTTAGSVTGGGWIDSPTGALTSDPTLSGKSSFGFVSKYLKGATVPTGNTEFQFQAGDLNFKTTAYEWLVVNQAGSNAQFKGTGTINGNGNYKFMIWASDGSPDTFRIKIWTEDASGENIVYDNGVSQAISRGSIVIVTKK